MWTRAENIHVIELGKLFRGECFCWPEDHVTRIVNDDIEPPRFTEAGQASAWLPIS